MLYVELNNDHIGSHFVKICLPVINLQDILPLNSNAPIRNILPSYLPEKEAKKQGDQERENGICGFTANKAATAGVAISIRPCVGSWIRQREVSAQRMGSGWRQKWCS